MIPVHERFATWQGEGVHMGRSAFFIRTYGCPQKCPWCDSAGTWHPSYIPEHINKMEELALCMEAAESGAKFVVITGGEPAIFNLDYLTHLLLDRYYMPVHIETSGAYKLKGAFSWITCSPKDKWAKPALREVIEAADEFKLIIEDPSDLTYWEPKLAWKRLSSPVWLHPEWSHREDPAVLNAITEWVKKHGDPYRAGWQIHKCYRADLLDGRSAAAVPLGGDLTKGY